MTVTDPTPFLPTTAEGWSTLAANAFTVIGAVSIYLSIQLNLHLILYWQRREARAEESAVALQELAYKAAPRPADATMAILNAVLDWKGSHTRYQDGLSPDEVRRLNGRQREEYDLWVSRLLAAFDLVLLDVSARNAADVQAMIREEIAKHGAILTWPWPFRFLHFPTSDLLKAIVRETLGHQAGKTH